MNHDHVCFFPGCRQHHALWVTYVPEGRMSRPEDLIEYIYVCTWHKPYVEAERRRRRDELDRERTKSMLARVADEEEADDSDRPHYRNRRG